LPATWESAKRRYCEACSRWPPTQHPGKPLLQAFASFIENNGVPWHNNAVERALRHLAVQRKISGALSEKGAGNYLRILSIAQTCRFQRKSFLGFLLSKSTNIDEYR